jgi:hypothetical protein
MPSHRQHLQARIELALPAMGVASLNFLAGTTQMYRELLDEFAA